MSKSNGDRVIERDFFLAMKCYVLFYCCLILLDVKKPEIVLNSQVDFLESAQPLNFSCEATGDPPPALAWYKDGVEISAGRSMEVIGYQRSVCGYFF